MAQVQYLTEVMKADGGVIITSSHNPEPWNGAYSGMREGAMG
jgi:phosphomannomutase